MRALKWVAGLLLGVLVLAAGGIVALVLALQAGTLTPRLQAAIEGATGRAAVLGEVSLRPGLVPRLAVDGAMLANIEGGSRPEMARVRRIEASLALLPLLRGEVAFGRIALDGADILLERLADGRTNWTIERPRDQGPPSTAPAPPPAQVPEAGRRQVSVGEILLTDSRIALPDPRLGTILVERLSAEGIGARGPVAIAARLALHGVPLALEATTGAVPPGSGVPWPLRARVAAGANRVTAEGALGGPLALAATLPEPAVLLPLLAALAPGAPLPPVLPPAEASLTLGVDRVPQDMRIILGAADLGALVPGLLLTRLEASLPQPEAPAEVTAEGSRNGLPFRLRLSLDAPTAFLRARAERPLMIVAELAAGGATASVTGRIARPRQPEGATFEVRLAAPDLGALTPAFPEVPPLRDLTVTASLAAPGRLDGAWRVAPFRLASTTIRAEGEVTIRPGRPVGLEGRVSAARIDLDALGEALAARQPAAVRPPAPATAPPRPAPAPAAEARVIPDIPLPLAMARIFAGRLDLAADHLIVGGTDWRQMRGRLALADGTARLTGFAAITPGGPVRGEGSLDAAATPPAISLALRSEGPGLDLGALRRARQEAAGIEGRAEVRIDVQGRGATTRAVAATLTGEAGLALIEGRLARAGMLRLGPDLLGLLLPGAPQDGLELRCLALRVSAEDGMARTSALLAETSAGRIEGVAAVNLATEGLAARLLPDITLFGVRVRAPVGIGGTLAAPRVGVEPGRALTQVIGDTVANRLWRDPTVEWLRGRAGGGAAPAGDCAAQLRIARFGAEGPVPAAPRIVPGVPRELQGTAQDVLRGLGGLLGGGRR